MGLRNDSRVSPRHRVVQTRFALALPGVLLLAVAWATACQTRPVEPEDPEALLQTAGGIEDAVLVESDDARRWPEDPYELVEASIDGDVLTLDIRFGGGCEEHRFALVTSRIFLESYPVQMPAHLSHDASGDPCRALVRETLRVNLRSVKRAYRETYGDAPDVLSLVIDGVPVRYAFE